METIVKRITCGGTWLSCGISAYKWEEEFIVPMVIPAQHQWYKITRRMNRLMTSGRRVRGDVLI
ncbi:hypothetical protein [Paenibacillus sp. UMB4589-SE434]|uniref:hypothetical protein n=1 Tax=Paenibacillus sp. UMB4589-SE434 TaxID=3046314 RepID=UPI00255057A2|nr:hypothetical protein [Paenibacillus sp. UMB4589-SE434]MDK8182071.1 hypothetical protein [Paenibacillus sp. UMB4589-SE434]